MSTERTKRITTGQLIWTEEGWKKKNTTIISKFDVVLRKWVESNKEIVLIPIKELGFVKELEIDAVFVKEALNWVGEGPCPKVYFLQRFKIKIPELTKFEHHYVQKSEENRIVCYDFGVDAVWEISLDPKSDFVDKVGKMKSISTEKATELFKTKKVYPKLLKLLGSLTLEIV